MAQACGACQYINEPYETQLARKDAQMEGLFGALAAQDGAELRPIIAMEHPFGYRSKVTSPVAPGGRGVNGGRQILTGMYGQGTHRIVDTSGCRLEDPRAQQVIAALPGLMKRFRLAPYDEDAHRGFVRHIIVRVGHQSGEVLVTLVTCGERFPASRDFCRELVRKCPFITSVVQNINTARTNTILGQTERRLYGPGFILDRLCGLSLRISSQSFFQVNAGQTERLYEEAVALAGVDATTTVLDAYCGTGTIGLVAAARGAGRVIGVEAVGSAVADARENARHNGLQNTEFIAADAGEFMGRLVAAQESVDVVMIDPPRAGCSEEFLEAAGALGPKRIVYISCNPETQVRDVAVLRDKGYKLKVIQPVDMFPHTRHIESIALLEREMG